MLRGWLKMSNHVLLMDERQLIPRWHISYKSMALQFPAINSTSMSSGREIEDDVWIEESRLNWRHERTILNATELNMGLFINNKLEDRDYLETLDFLLSNYGDLPKGTAELVNRDKGDEKRSYYSADHRIVRKKIRALKSKAKEFPRDSVLLVDMAFYYTVLGQDRKAERLLKTAWEVCRYHPFVSKAYSRYLVHKGSPEEAVWVLKKTGGVNHNPLISSAYIAINNSFDLPGGHAGGGKKLLDSYTGEPAFLSDLAACLGTIEFKNGRVKKAKKLFEKALCLPSENAMSQYGWLKQKHGFFVDESGFVELESIENDANRLYVEGGFEGCRSKLLDLYYFQPFTDAPLVDAGYMSLLGLKDPGFVVNLSKNRVPKVHMSFGELNNLVVAKLMLNELCDIEVDMKLLARKADGKDDAAKGVFLATSGMVMFKIGDWKRGGELYEASIKYFKSKRMERSVALAEHFYSQNLKFLDIKRYARLRESVVLASKKHKMKELLVEWG